MAQFEPGHKKIGGRAKGAKNKKTILLERVYQRCCAVGFHPADYMIAVATDPLVPRSERLAVCRDLLAYMEGRQPEGKPLTPATPGDSVEAANRLMQEAAARSTPIEPTPTPTPANA